MRAALILVSGWILLTLQTSALWVLPAVPDLAVPLAFYLGATREPIRGALLAGALGYIADLLGGGPRGLHILLSMVISLLASGLATRLIVRGVLFVSALSFVAAVLSQLLALGLLAAFQRGFEAYGLLLGDVLPVATATGLFAYPVHALCARIDGLGRKAREEGVLLR